MSEKSSIAIFAALLSAITPLFAIPAADYYSAWRNGNLLVTYKYNKIEIVNFLYRIKTTPAGGDFELPIGAPIATFYGFQKSNNKNTSGTTRHNDNPNTWGAGPIYSEDRKKYANRNNQNQGANFTNQFSPLTPIIPTEYLILTIRNTSSQTKKDIYVSYANAYLEYETEKPEDIQAPEHSAQNYGRSIKITKLDPDDSINFYIIKMDANTGLHQTSNKQRGSKPEIMSAYGLKIVQDNKIVQINDSSAKLLEIPLIGINIDSEHLVYLIVAPWFGIFLLVATALRRRKENESDTNNSGEKDLEEAFKVINSSILDGINSEKKIQELLKLTDQRRTIDQNTPG